jgi:hypothetical protein
MTQFGQVSAARLVLQPGAIFAVICEYRHGTQAEQLAVLQDSGAIPEHLYAARQMPPIDMHGDTWQGTTGLGVDAARAGGRERVP